MVLSTMVYNFWTGVGRHGYASRAAVSGESLIEMVIALMGVVVSTTNLDFIARLPVNSYLGESATSR